MCIGVPYGKAIIVKVLDAVLRYLSAIGETRGESLQEDTRHYRLHG